MTACVECGGWLSGPDRPVGLWPCICKKKAAFVPSSTVANIVILVTLAAMVIVPLVLLWFVYR